MPPQRIRRHLGHAKEQVHLNPTDAVSGLQSQLNHCPERHPPQPVTLPEFKLVKWSICPPDIRIRIQLFPVPKYLDKETVHDPDFDPDMLTDDGSYTLCGVVMQLTMILKTRAAD